MRCYRTVVFLSVLILLSATAGLSEAFWSKKPINTNWQGLAIKGYDPVAYFVKGKPVKGKMEFETEWGGAKWRFSDAESLARFTSEPEKYAPQFGGY